MSEKEFYEMYEGDTWNIACYDCNKIVECKPHYRDAPNENDYGICSICGKKLYVRD